MKTEHSSLTNSPLGSAERASKIEAAAEQMLRLDLCKIPALIQAAHNSANTENDPQKKALAMEYAEALKALQHWKLHRIEPGLFRLYKHANGKVKAVLEEKLQTRSSRLSEGIDSNREGLASIVEAFQALLYADLLIPRHVLPKLGDIPDPEIDQRGRLNAIEIHKAAMSLFYKILPVSIVFEIIQRNLAPRFKLLGQGSKVEKIASARALKRDLGKAIDAFAHEEPVSHGNKPLFKNTSQVAKSAPLLAIEEATNLFEGLEALPTKAALRAKLEKAHPFLTISDRAWPKILKEAGLERLPQKVPFSSS
ncbi:hypothetical protein [Prosthecobacter sp.]|uniref:hypothetical protein n=1 Tax=Prosthecobacter sp. TaxID=1965333 RepID=UPI002488C9DF|nr:hypothetical protein [Prosthecobacter sp.]MDI1313511.1 hypothetical protein [Prosthecobacter sp.]